MPLPKGLQAGAKTGNAVAVTAILAVSAGLVLFFMRRRRRLRHRLEDLSSARIGCSNPIPKPFSYLGDCDGCRRGYVGSYGSSYEGNYDDSYDGDHNGTSYISPWLVEHDLNPYIFSTSNNRRPIAGFSAALLPVDQATDTTENDQHVFLDRHPCEVRSDYDRSQSLGTVQHIEATHDDARPSGSPCVVASTTKDISGQQLEMTLESHQAEEARFVKSHNEDYHPGSPSDILPILQGTVQCQNDETSSESIPSACLSSPRTLGGNSLDGPSGNQHRSPRFANDRSNDSPGTFLCSTCSKTFPNKRRRE